MDKQPGVEARINAAAGTLTKFHLGLAADGMSCAMVFVDEQQHSIGCIATFPDLMGFIVSLQRVAAEMARRRALLEDSEGDEHSSLDVAGGAINVASTDFRMCADDGSLLGSLVGEGGQVVGMRPDVANEMTRNMLRAARVASKC